MTHDDEHRPDTPAKGQSSGWNVDHPHGTDKNPPGGTEPSEKTTNWLDPTAQPGTVAEDGSADADPAVRRLAGGAVMAWLMIALMVSLSVALRQLPEEESKESFDRAELPLLEFQAKYFVGAAELPTLGGGQLVATASQLDRGPLVNRLCYIVLLGELDGPKAAAEALVRLEERIEQADYVPPAQLAESLEALRGVYGDFQDELWHAPSLLEVQRQTLIDCLGWFGELALAPPKGPDTQKRSSVLRPARRTVMVLLLATTVGAFVLLGGVGGFVGFSALVVTRRIRSSLGQTFSDGNIYAETFALWMVLFAAFSILGAALAGDEAFLAAQLTVMILSLTALGWPFWRGIAAGQVCRDIGLTTGRGGLVELFWGLVCYASTLPLVIFGLIVTVMLMQIPALAGATPGDEFAPTNTPAHPLIQWVAEAGWWGAIQIILVACVAAPLVEETMFRGVLYRHLRQATVTWRVGWSVLASTVVNAFIFAIIHPQGIVAVPPLMALAVGFSLAREWRGSLLAPITAHAVNNGVVTLVLLSIL